MGNVLTRLVLKPGQKGTKRLTKIYGDKLVCVRYKYDMVRSKRLKTVEIIVDEQEWRPTDIKYLRNPSVYVRISGYEKELRSRVKKAGGMWYPERRLWQVSLRSAIRLGLKQRIIWE